jgi:hypothetical protein
MWLSPMIYTSTVRRFGRAVLYKGSPITIILFNSRHFGDRVSTLHISSETTFETTKIDNFIFSMKSRMDMALNDFNDHINN